MNQEEVSRAIEAWYEGHTERNREMLPDRENLPAGLWGSCVRLLCSGKGHWLVTLKADLDDYLIIVDRPEGAKIESADWRAPDGQPGRGLAPRRYRPVSHSGINQGGDSMSVGESFTSAFDRRARDPDRLAMRNRLACGECKYDGEHTMVRLLGHVLIAYELGWPEIHLSS